MKAGIQNQNIVSLMDKLEITGGILYLKLKSSSNVMKPCLVQIQIKK